MRVYLIILLLSFLSGISTLIGAGLSFFVAKSRALVNAGLGFAAGIMVLLSFFEMLPEAYGAVGLKALIGFFVGAAMLFIAHKYIPHAHIKGLMELAYLIALGLILHDFPEGFAMANSYIASPALGVLVTVGIALHNVPEEFAIALPFVRLKKYRRLLVIAGLSALAEPAGASLGILVVEFFRELNPYFIAFAAGAMVYVSFEELIPFVGKQGKRTWALIGGLAAFGCWILMHLIAW